LATAQSAIDPQTLVTRRSTKLWLWPNLLSLDAPIVALVWQVLFAYSFRAKFDGLAASLLVLSVWIIYVADRLVDAWRGSNLQRRHEFHRQNWRVIVSAWLAVFAATAWLALTQLPTALFARGVVLLAVVTVYFGFTHLSKRRWPKELAVAVLFAAGTSLTTWGQARSWIDVATIVLFGMLCWINCAAIEKWENRGLNDWPVRGASIAVGLIALIFLYDQRPIISGAETASAFAFVMLDHAKSRLSSDALRVLADVALLTPILFLPLIGLRA
jgi:multisubunit Na+/H+ antiporter MnhE subunit